MLEIMFTLNYHTPNSAQAVDPHQDFLFRNHSNITNSDHQTTAHSTEPTDPESVLLYETDLSTMQG